jgi:hypothetical protein
MSYANTVEVNCSKIPGIRSLLIVHLSEWSLTYFNLRETVGVVQSLEPAHVEGRDFKCDSVSFIDTVIFTR